MLGGAFDGYGAPVRVVGRKLWPRCATRRHAKCNVAYDQYDFRTHEILRFECSCSCHRREDEEPNQRHV